jgi:hypothetical protein
LQIETVLLNIGLAVNRQRKRPKLRLGFFHGKLSARLGPPALDHSDIDVE